MNPRMYIFLNKGLGMSTGKAAAQAAHAAVEAALLSNCWYDGGAMTEKKAALWDAWRLGLHYTKIVLEADDSQQMLVIDRYLTERGIEHALIIDEGRTEDTRFVPTAIGCVVVDKDDPHAAATFSSFRTYRDPAPATVKREPTITEKARAYIARRRPGTPRRTGT